MSDIGFIGGEVTQRVFCSLEQGHRMSAEEAWRAIQEDQAPLWERLSRYVVERVDGSCDEDAVTCAYRAQDILKERGAAKGFPRDSWRKNVEKWTDHSWMVRSFDPESIFKLCLALDLSLEDAREFVWDQLYQDWFSYRSQEELVYQYFIARQQDFGSEAYWHAKELIEQLKKSNDMFNDASLASSGTVEWESVTATGLTKLIRGRLDKLVSLKEREAGLKQFQRFLRDNSACFDGMQRTSSKYYRYLTVDGGQGIPSLRKFFNDSSSFPDWRDKNKGYGLFDLDQAKATKYPIFPITALFERKEWRDGLKTVARVLGEARGREAERGGNDSKRGAKKRYYTSEANLYDPIPAHMFTTSRKTLEKEGGVPRGNLIAILFLQRCAEESLRARSESGLIPYNRVDGHLKELFGSFYREANYMLSECCMLPLHPRNPFDRLFLETMANIPSEVRNGDFTRYYNLLVEYLNKLLRGFYPRPKQKPWGKQDLEAWECYRSELLAPYRGEGFTDSR